MLLNNFLQCTTNSFFWIKNLEATTCKKKLIEKIEREKNTKKKIKRKKKKEIKMKFK